MEVDQELLVLNLKSDIPAPLMALELVSIAHHDLQWLSGLGG